jgi:hypothetical protein
MLDGECHSYIKLEVFFASLRIYANINHNFPPLNQPLVPSFPETVSKYFV